jgi:hypothetical protein
MAFESDLQNKQSTLFIETEEAMKPELRRSVLETALLLNGYVEKVDCMF